MDFAHELAETIKVFSGILIGGVGGGLWQTYRMQGRFMAKSDCKEKAATCVSHQESNHQHVIDAIADLKKIVVKMHDDIYILRNGNK